MRGKVADASVLGAIAFREDRGPEALTLLGGGPLYEPPLLTYELASIARKKHLSGLGQIDDLARLLTAALTTEIHWVEINPPEVLRLAVETGLTTYDASYLYVAKVMDLPLVTFDERLARAAANLA